MLTSPSSLFPATDSRTALPNLSGLDFPALPLPRPLLMIGHGTKDSQGRDSLLEFAHLYYALDPCRPVFPCFLELTGPTIQEVVSECVAQGYTELSVLPILLFAARHNKFDVTNELDRARQHFPQLRFHYGRHFGITPGLLSLWQDRLQELDLPAANPLAIPRSETVLLVVGRGSSDPDANGDVLKLARMLWEGSGYQTVETCFIGITHPRLEEGFRRARLYQPRRIIVLPYFLFTGLLVQKIVAVSAEQQAQHPDILISGLPEMGLHPQLFSVLRQREVETQLGQVQMNCEMCKFRLATGPTRQAHTHSGEDQVPHPDHGSGHSHASHDHSHGHGHSTVNLDQPENYHQRVWQVP